MNHKTSILIKYLLFQLQLVSSQGCLVEQKTCYTDDKLQPVRNKKEEQEVRNNKAFKRQKKNKYILLFVFSILELLKIHFWVRIKGYILYQYHNNKLFFIKSKHFLSTLPEGTPETLLWFLGSYQMSRQWQWQACEFKQEKKSTKAAHQFTLIWSEFSNVELPAVRVSIGHSSKCMNQPRSRHNQAHSWPGKWNVNSSQKDNKK